MTTKEFKQFDMSMDAILHADPKAVKEAVDAEIRANTAVREAKGEHKRGRKRKVKNDNRDKDSI